ncbi:hypothetical protein FHU38_000385 [Saccharomonospora amisosensis]|uniref:Uncharacterized protein n=1 Tax=Saccharomonospora amisosensis TaxID=1128677 RepID=A0A7X5UL76_9PSEU|nr:hypothetical protein [Saccharomonospora amisosensis]
MAVVRTLTRTVALITDISILPETAGHGIQHGRKVR